MRGGYAGHGETFVNPEDILWWSHGGKLHGESPARIRFLHEILTQTPGLGSVSYTHLAGSIPASRRARGSRRRFHPKTSPAAFYFCTA